MGCVPAREFGAEDDPLTESEVVNGWQLPVRLATRRESIEAVLAVRFPGEVTSEITAALQRIESLTMLRSWLIAAIDAASIDAFLDVIGAGPSEDELP